MRTFPSGGGPTCMLPASLAFWICAGFGGTYRWIKAAAVSMYSFMSSFLFSTTFPLTRPPPRATAACPWSAWAPAADRNLCQLSVGAVVDALLLARLLLALEADGRGLDPFVLPETLLALSQVLLQRGDHLVRGGRSLGDDACRRQRREDPDSDRAERECVVSLHKRRMRQGARQLSQGVSTDRSHKHLPALTTGREWRSRSTGEDRDGLASLAVNRRVQ